MEWSEWSSHKFWRIDNVGLIENWFSPVWLHFAWSQTLWLLMEKLENGSHFQKVPVCLNLLLRVTWWSLIKYCPLCSNKCNLVLYKIAFIVFQAVLVFEGISKRLHESKQILFLCIKCRLVRWHFSFEQLTQYFSPPPRAWSKETRVSRLRENIFNQNQCELHSSASFSPLDKKSKISWCQCTLFKLYALSDAPLLMSADSMLYDHRRLGAWL